MRLVWIIPVWLLVATSNAAERPVAATPVDLLRVVEMSASNRTWISLDGGLAVALSTYRRFTAGDHVAYVYESDREGSPLPGHWIEFHTPEDQAGPALFAEPYLLLDRDPPNLRRGSGDLVIGARSAIPVTVDDPLGVGSVEYLIDGQPAADFESHGSRRVTLEVIARDAGGNETRANYNVTYDADLPSGRLLVDGIPVQSGQLDPGRSSTFSVEATDPTSLVSAVSYRFDNDRWRRMPDEPVEFDREATQLAIKVVDQGGNVLEQTWGLNW